MEPARQEEYTDAPDGTRRVQYFEKARMELGLGGVTNGLLTTELITGRRQFGDTRFGTFAPCTLPLIGDTDNAWPTYASLNAKVFPEQADQSDERVDLVYKADGTFTHDAKLGAKAGAAAGGYVRDPGGRFAHNIPAAFWRHLNALPVRWETAMGYPLTEPFWAQVRVRGAKTWVLVQPFERRVLSYTPDNDPAFAVEMGNIGSHYWLWRYQIAPDEGSTPVARAAGTGKATPASAAARVASAATEPEAATSPGTPTIRALRLGLVTDSTASLSFETDLPATTRLVYGTASHAYQWSQEISVAAVPDHRVTIAGLTPKTKYYFGEGIFRLPLPRLPFLPKHWKSAGVSVQSLCT